QGSEQDGYRKFVKIIHDHHRNYQIQIPVSEHKKGNVKHHETVEKLRHNGRAGSAEPDHSLAGGFAKPVKNRSIQKLRKQKGDDRAQNNAHALPENTAVSKINVVGISGGIFGI